VRAVDLGHISPSQAIADDVDNPADHPAIIDTRPPMRAREADVGIVTAINAAMDAAVATRFRNLRAIHSSI